MTARPMPSSREPGSRAEEVASWYFRLNGFLQIPGFVLHSDDPRRAVTDADVLAVRFPYSQESLRGVRMVDDRWLSNTTRSNQVLVVIAEVKASLCHVNGPWRDPARGGMERVLRRIGFAPEDKLNVIADSLYKSLHWENDDFWVQYVCIGDRPNHDLAKRYPQLKQLTWADIAAFMWERFGSFGPIKGAPRNWPMFGREFADAVLCGRVTCAHTAIYFVKHYVDVGPNSN
jgi:hypothetical protein